jgi:hypothetical protein
MHESIVSPNVAVPGGGDTGDTGAPGPPAHLGADGAQLGADVVRQYRIGDGAASRWSPRPRSASTECGRRRRPSGRRVSPRAIGTAASRRTRLSRSSAERATA